MDWIAAFLTILGNVVLIQYKHWSSFVIFLFANSIWVVYWIGKREYAVLIVVAIFLCQNVWGIISWRKNART
jgi:hypothetical protein